MDDLVMLVESWGKYDPVVDTTPPFGDGAVDVQDLELLMSYWQESVDDPTLVAHWTLDEEGGTAALDEVSGNKDAVVGGAVWHSNAGRVNGAIQLDGVDDAVVVDRVVSLAHRPLSIVTWIRGGAVGQTIISERGEANWLSAGPSDGALMTGPDDVTADGGPLQSAVVITEGEWHRIGLVWDGSQRMLYVDGSMVAADQPDEMHVHASGLYIGCGMDATAGTYWSGMIDDVRIYRRALKL